jgi:2-polyprenyl-3-methyl-5-hydroxy-6-metoxy-1,4-benzoquinol methylase
MDNLHLAGDELHQTLDGLSVINRYLGNTNASLQAVKKEILQAKVPLKIIDLGCGGGDNLRAIAAWAAQQGYPVTLTGIDGNANTLEYARAKNTSLIQVRYLQADILNPSFSFPACDILMSSHFMYHFSDEALIGFLRKAKERGTGKILFSELQRSTLAYLLFKIGTPFLPFSRMVKQDGLQAIRRSFTRKELISIFQRAEIKAYRIQWKWAFRWMVSADLS